MTDSSTSPPLSGSSSSGVSGTTAVADAVQEAIHVAVRHDFSNLKLPWEAGGAMSVVFGKQEIVPEVFPMIPLPGPLPPLESPEDVKRAKRARRVDVSAGLFLKAINFGARLSDSQTVSLKWDRALEKWYGIVTEDLSSSLIGASLPVGELVASLKMLRELFGKKSVETVSKRANALVLFFAWARKRRPFEAVIPFDGAMIDAYLQSLRDESAPAGRFHAFTEAVNFAVHVVGISVCESRCLWSPWSKGLVGLNDINRQPREPRHPLTVAMVRSLEEMLADVLLGIIDRYACGAFLFAIYSRSRSSDLRLVEDWILDLESVALSEEGFVECSTRSHKTANLVARSGLAMPLVAVACGVGRTSWATTWVRVAVEAGLPLDGRQKGPVLPAPNPDGFWSERAATSGEMTRWLKALLERCHHDVEKVTSHSLKHTTLSWTAKYGLERSLRLRLGHHSDKDGSLDAYSRDLLAPALIRYVQIIKEVRIGAFAPDLSRSGRFVPEGERSWPRSPGQGADSFPDVGLEQQQPLVELEQTANRSPDGNGLSTEGGSLAGSLEPLENEVEEEVERAWYDQARNASEGPAADSSDESSSSSSTYESTSDGSDRLVADAAFTESAAAGNAETWRPDCIMFEHKKTKVIHLQARGSSSGHFVCGRAPSNDHRQIERAFFFESRCCKQCASSKLLRDRGGHPSLGRSCEVSANMCVVNSRVGAFLCHVHVIFLHACAAACLIVIVGITCVM